MSKQFEQWETLDVVSRLEQSDNGQNDNGQNSHNDQSNKNHRQSIFTEINTHREPIEQGLRDQELTFQDKALSRANQLAHATSIKQQAQNFQSKTTLARGALTVCMILLGGLAVINVFDNSTNQVNIFWLLIMLLGVNTISMLLYLASSLQKTINLRSIPTFLFKTILSIFSKKIPGFATPEKNSFMNSWSAMNLSGDVGRWSLSRYLHGAWLAYLLGALATLIMILLTKQIDFVWGTTLLNSDAFIQLTSGMSKLQSSLGLPTLSADQILHSRVGSASNTLDLAQNRQQWAYFLIVSLLLFGTLPRLILWAFCTFRQFIAKRHYQPEWNTPYFVQLRERMIPSISAAAIVDADTHKQAPVSGGDTSKPQTNGQRLNLSTLNNHLTDHSQLFAYEWFPRHPWPLVEHKNDLGIISDRDQQQKLINHLKETSQQDEVTICLSSEHVADRGALRFFTRLNQHATLQLMIFDFNNQQPLKRRWTEWLHLADQLNIPHDQVFLVDARQSETPSAH